MVFLSISRRTRRTPFTGINQRLGVQSYTVYNRMLLPAYFRSLEEDYVHLCQHVQLWDVSAERQVEIRGADSGRLVQLMTPRNIGTIAPGCCGYIPLIDETAGIVNDPVLLCFSANRYWLSVADSDVVLWAHGLAYGLGLDVEVFEPAVFPLGVQGPKSDDLMARVFGSQVRGLKFFHFAQMSFEGHPLVVARSGWSKQGGFEIFLDDEALAEPLWAALWAAGEDLSVGPGCPNGIERIESGLLSYGNDMTLENNPLECGLGRYCDLTSPLEYMGRDALRSIAAEGVKRRMCQMIFEGPVVELVPPFAVLAEGEEVGQMTSCCRSVRYGSNLGLGLVRADRAYVGSTIEVVHDHAVRRGQVREVYGDMQG